LKINGNSPLIESFDRDQALCFQRNRAISVRRRHGYQKPKILVLAQLITF
jgi:hypothetical protein